MRGRFLPPMYRFDALFAVVVGAAVWGASFGAGSNQPDARHMDGWAALLIAAGALGLVFRRRWPALALGVALLTTMVFISRGYPFGPIFAFTVIAMYSIAAWRSFRYAVLAALAAVAVHLPVVLLANDGGLALTLVAAVAWLATPVGIGCAVRARRDARDREVAESRQRHAYEERLRIAQEVHDVVGHSLAVISMNAGAALHVLSKQPAGQQPEVEQSLRAIRQSSNGALDELRATLATFTGSPAVRRPAPGLALLPELVAATSRAVNGGSGLTVTLEVAGERGPVPSSVDTAGYRIAQEALTNVVRHAAASRAVVRVGYEPCRVELSVTDDGRAPAPVNPGGTGLDSMRERAHAAGGTLTAGPLPAGGFEVRAVLPYEGRDA